MKIWRSRIPAAVFPAWGVACVFLVATGPATAALIIDTTAPSGVVLSNPNTGGFTSAFNNGSGRGQSMLMPGTGDVDNPLWSVTGLTLRKGLENGSYGAGDRLDLWVWAWNPSNNGNDFSGWDSGDGLADGDPLDGTGMTALVNGQSFLLPASVALNDYLHFDFSASPLIFNESSAYGFFFNFVDANTGTGDTRFRFMIPGAHYYGNGRLLLTDGTSNFTDINQDLTFFISATAVPEPGRGVLALIGAVAMLGRRRKTSNHGKRLI